MDSKDEIDEIAGFANEFLLSTVAMNKKLLIIKKVKSAVDSIISKDLVFFAVF